MLYVQISSAFDTIGSTVIKYRVTDGQQVSQPATVTLQTGTNAGNIRLISFLIALSHLKRSILRHQFLK